MAAATMGKEDTRRFRRTYGSLAYAQPAYAPGQEEVLRPQPKVRQREEVQTRPRVEARQAGRVSPFAIVGFLAVGVLAALLMLSYTRLTVAADQVAHLKEEITTLEGEQAKLLAKYELTYDLGTIEAKVTGDGSMVKPVAGQIFMLNLTKSDDVVHYDEQGEPIQPGA